MNGTKSWGASRSRVFETLRASGVSLSVPTVADRCGLHPNTARFHLDRLVEAGHVRRSTSNSDGRGRPTMMYAVPEHTGATEGHEYQFLAEILADSVAAGGADAADQARRSGVDRGAQLARSTRTAPCASPAEAKAGLTDMLETTGFAPELVSSGGKNRIDLRRCPFAAVVEQQGEIVCSVHLGLMQGMLDTLDSGVQVRRLDPNLASGRCIAHLSEQ